MKIETEQIEHLAALSKLELSQSELAQLSGELETIVNYMGILSQLSVETADPIDPPLSLHNVLREDRITCSQDRADLLSNAPETDGETLTVPKTVD